MSEKTKITWCDSTVNFWRGCAKVSAGCANCYAEKLVVNRLNGSWGKGSPRIRSKSAVKDALAFNRKPWICNGFGEEQKVCDHGHFHRRRIFSLSLGDWLDDEVPIDWLVEMLDTIFHCGDCIWILCSKRLENFSDRMCRAWRHFQTGSPAQNWLDQWLRRHNPPANVFLLASVENQHTADLRIPELLRLPAALKGLSVEPLLGPVYLRDEWLDNIGWLIIGGESGPGARPCDVEWIRLLHAQGEHAHVPVFVKQLGSHCRLRDRKGGDMTEWPLDLRVRQWPFRA